MKIKKSRIKEIIGEEIIKEFKELIPKGKVFSKVKNKQEALDYLKKQNIKYTNEESNLHKSIWLNGNNTVAELNKNLLVVYENINKQQQRLDEALSKQDYVEIKEIIRAEIAAVFFDLFRKRGVWI